MVPDVHESLEGALSRLPHGAPFRFVTRLVALEPGRFGEGIWSVHGGEEFLKGHFPGDPIVPGVLICEALAQLSGLVGLHGAGAGRLVHTDVRFDGSARPPSEIALRAAQVRALGRLRQFEVTASVGGEVVARGQLTLAAVDQQ